MQYLCFFFLAIILGSLHAFLYKLKNTLVAKLLRAQESPAATHTLQKFGNPST